MACGLKLSFIALSIAKTVSLKRVAVLILCAAGSIHSVLRLILTRRVVLPVVLTGRVPCSCVPCSYRRYLVHIVQAWSEIDEDDNGALDEEELMQVEP